LRLLCGVQTGKAQRGDHQVTVRLISIVRRGRFEGKRRR
jgi:hypothetical protein